MSVAGATTVVGDNEYIALLPTFDTKGKTRMPTETTHYETLKPSFHQVGPRVLVYVPPDVLIPSLSRYRISQSSNKSVPSLSPSTLRLAF